MDHIKIIICDLDGTLLNDQELISKRNLAAIKRLKKEGYLFGFATGRPIVSVESLAKKWKVQDELDMVIGLNGGHVKDYTLNKEERYYQIDGHLIENIVLHFKGYPVNFGVYVEDYLAVLKDDALAKRLSLSDNVPYRVVDFKELYQSSQSKLIVMTDPKDMSLVSKRGQEYKHPKLKSLQAGHIEYEYMHPQLSKSYGLKQVCLWHGVTLNNMLAFGDADNDADMIHDVGVGVAMDNASVLTKSNADAITLSNQEDGVAVFLEKNILK